MAKKWTDADLGTLRTMYIAGMTYREIARILERSPSACQQRAHHMGLPKMRKQQQQQNVSAALTRQDEMTNADEISLDVVVTPPTPELTTQPKPKPAWWKRLLGIGG